MRIDARLTGGYGPRERRRTCVCFVSVYVPSASSGAQVLEAVREAAEHGPWLDTETDETLDKSFIVDVTDAERLG